MNKTTPKIDRNHAQNQPPPPTLSQVLRLTLKKTMGIAADFFDGAMIFNVYDFIATGGKNFATLCLALYNPAALDTTADPGAWVSRLNNMIKVNFYRLLDEKLKKTNRDVSDIDFSKLPIPLPEGYTREQVIDFFRQRIEEARESPYVFKNPKAMKADLFLPIKIWLSKCPKASFREHYEEIFSEPYPVPTLLSFCKESAPKVLYDEFVYRYVIQDWLLHKKFKQILEWGAPDYAYIADSTIYTAYRIFCTAWLYAGSLLSMAQQIRPELDEEELERIATTALITGVVLGILKEFIGINASIGAHMFHDVVAFLPELYDIC